MHDAPHVILGCQPFGLLIQPEAFEGQTAQFGGDQFRQLEGNRRILSAAHRDDYVVTFPVYPADPVKRGLEDVPGSVISCSWDFEDFARVGVLDLGSWGHAFHVYLARVRRIRARHAAGFAGYLGGRGIILNWRGRRCRRLSGRGRRFRGGGLLLRRRRRGAAFWLGLRGRALDRARAGLGRGCRAGIFRGRRLTGDKRGKCQESDYSHVSTSIKGLPCTLHRLMILLYFRSLDPPIFPAVAPIPVDLG